MNPADLVRALDLPAALVDEGGALICANDAFRAAGVKAARLCGAGDGERVETGGFVWSVRPLPEGGRLISGAPTAVPGAREAYLAALSHELRTPMNGLLGMAGLLENTRLDADQRAYLKALKDSGEHLLGLVNDVLDLAKLDAGTMDLEPAPTDLERLLQGVCELLSPRAWQKGLEIAWAVAPSLPRIMADEGRLRQILFNLAGNALKFTEAGGALLSVETRARSAGGLRLRLQVSDTGPGVPAGERGRIFDPFARVSGPAARLEGAGLGLAIVRRLAEAHDGLVGVNERPGGGSIFWFEAEFPQAEPAPAPSRALAGVRVAVLSLNPAVTDSAVRQVEACGGTAWRHAPMRALEAGTADIALVDNALRVPGRALRPPAGVPALVMLAPEERARIPACRKAGFAGYLIKPLRRASLAERISAVLGAADNGPAPGEDDRIAPASGAGLKVLLAEDNPINALLARTLLEREGCAVERAADGQEALDAALSGRHDLVLMDVRMPGLDGVEAARRLRAAGRTVPIIALTADAFEEDRRACLAAGMNDFISKPLDPAALRAVLGRARRADWTSGAGEAKLAG